jgi:glycolate oxidase iron-sulfur subunit
MSTQDNKTEIKAADLLVPRNPLLDKFDMDEIMNCMHCGFCLPVCPTYQQTGLESYSPRGRIALMKGVATEKLDLDAEFAKNMDACLGCRACETACPAGVQYGRLIETAREVVVLNKKAQQKPPLVRRLIFNHLFPHPKRMSLLGNFIWFSQVTGLQKLANTTGLIKIMPKEMVELQHTVKTIASPFERKARQKFMKAEKEAKLTVGFFKGCIMDVMFYEINQQTARVLTKAGCNVEFIEDQACCGALHAHSGEKDGAMELAKRNIIAFEKAGVDYIVNNAGGCGAALKEYDHWFKDDPEWHERAKNFVSKCRDANELLAELPPITFHKPIDARVTYQDSCHLAHGQGIRNQPRQLIKSIPGIEYTELNNADTCCGSAGVYNIVQYDMSMQVLGTKMENVKNTKAHIVVTSNPGCLIQMKHGIIREGLQDKMEAVHIMELLDRAL